MSRDSLRGNLFENYVVTETIKHFWSHGRNAPLYFFRDNIGNEVDLLIEKARQVAAIEIKAGQTVNSDWFKGLEYLKRGDGEKRFYRVASGLRRQRGIRKGRDTGPVLSRRQRDGWIDRKIEPGYFLP